MGPLTLDANVVIGALDRADAQHARAVQDLDRADRAGRALRLPASAFSETLVDFARIGGTARAVQAIKGLGIEVEPLTAAIAEHAAGLRATTRALTLGDALVLATAASLGGGLLTYDKRLARFA